MNNLPFSWIALGTGLLAGAGLLAAGALEPAAGWRIPALMMLIVTEFGFFVTAIGAGLGINRLLGGDTGSGLKPAVAGCVLLAAGFLWLGMRLWAAI